MDMFRIISDLPISPVVRHESPGNYIMQVQANDVGDEHHTMSELYEHRIALFIALMRALDKYVTPLSPPYAKCWKSEYHYDGTSYPGWFIAGISLIEVPWKGAITNQYISYHLPLKYWNTLEVVSLPKAPEYNGFTSKDVLERLLRL